MIPLTAFDLYFAVRCALQDRGVGCRVIVRTEDDAQPNAVVVVVVNPVTRRQLSVPFSVEHLHYRDTIAMFFTAAQVAKTVEAKLTEPLRVDSTAARVR